MNDLIATPKNEIVVYQPNETMRLDVRLENKTVWLSQEQMITLFGRDRSVISRHIRNAFDEGEVDQTNCLQILQTIRKGRPEVLYNLDVVISVGYRVKSAQGVLFRKWATSVLLDYMMRGYAVNTRLNQLEDRMDRRLAKNEQDIVELKDRVDFFVRTELPPKEGVLFEGQIKDGYDLALKIIRSAKKSVVLIDNWVDERVLTMLEERGAKVSATIYTKRCTKKLQLDVANHNRQYRPITLHAYTGAHDRFLIADSTVYHIGASLKDLGTALFAFSKMEIPASVVLSRLPPTNGVRHDPILRRFVCEASHG